jgi:hypothetical protein
MRKLPLTALAIAALGCSLESALAQCPPTGANSGPPPITLWSAGRAQAASPGSPAAPNPAGPAAPGPTTPKAPANTPDTTGPTTPARTSQPRLGPRTGGLALTFERGHTSKERLKVDWLHPVPTVERSGPTQTSGPLPLQDALAQLWENDQRPLLVLRECGICKGTDDALLSRSLKNDRTLLITKWFRTVRMPAHVVEESHPFYRLFQSLANTEGTPHVFLVAHPGADAVCFSGQQTQTQLWKAMTDVLAERYLKDANKAVKEWLSILDTFDTLDARRQQLQEQLDETRAAEGPESLKAKKLTEALAKVNEERDAALAHEAKVRDLGLQAMPKRTAAAAK